MQLEPDVHRECQQDEREPERDSPAPVRELLGIHHAASDTDHGQRKEETERRRRLDPARVVAAPFMWGMFRNVSRRAAVLSTERKPLYEPERYEQHGSRPANRCVSGQQTDQKCGAAHEDNGDQERVFAADKVTDPPEHDCAERTHEEARGIRGKRRHQSGGFIAWREKQRGKKRRQRRVQIEVVPLEDRAKGRSEYDSPLLDCLVQDLAVRRARICSHRLLPPFLRFRHSRNCKHETYTSYSNPHKIDCGHRMLRRNNQLRSFN